MRVALAPVELGDEKQPAALGRGQVTGQLGDLGFEPLERHRGGRVLGDSGRGKGGQRSLLDHWEAAPIIAPT
jgi:hypothetical protein